MNHYSHTIIFVLILGVFILGCEKKNVPEVNTSPVTDVTQSTASGGGEIVSNGGATIRSHGVCWGTSPNPTASGSKTDLGKSDGGSFTSSITGLKPSTTYYVRAYATNKAGTGYGNQVIISTRLADKDGNVYATVQIGNKLWMAENLRTTRYDDGSSIIYPGTDVTMWYSSSTGAYAWYDNDTTNRNIYGGLYNWHAVNNSSGICPSGWCVPTDEDWTTLIDYLGGENVAGSKLKQTGNTIWNQPNTDATNESGFGAIPGGLRDEMGVYGHLKWSGFYWSSTQYNLGNGWGRSLSTHNGSVVKLFSNKGIGYSVRCVKE